MISKKRNISVNVVVLPLAVLMACTSASLPAFTLCVLGGVYSIVRGGYDLLGLLVYVPLAVSLWYHR
jgi:hypothetical protein